MILRVGLTGGIASGKSTVLRLLGELGCRTVDADSIVAALYRPGRAGHEALVRVYGVSILRADGEIDRGRLADLAFASPEGSRRLNELIHPLVIEEQSRLMDEAAATGEDAIWVVEATLLIESGGRERFDRIVVVDVPQAVQIARGTGRGMAQTEVERRIAHQMAREERLRHADYVIENGGDFEQTRHETARVYELLLRDLASRKQKAPGAPRG
jgi:dephospho-CoA kinase